MPASLDAWASVLECGAGQRPAPRRWKKRRPDPADRVAAKGKVLGPSQHRPSDALRRRRKILLGPGRCPNGVGGLPLMPGLQAVTEGSPSTRRHRAMPYEFGPLALGSVQGLLCLRLYAAASKQNKNDETNTKKPKRSNPNKILTGVLQPPCDQKLSYTSFRQCSSALFQRPLARTYPCLVGL